MMSSVASADGTGNRVHGDQHGPALVIVNGPTP